MLIALLTSEVGTCVATRSSGAVLLRLLVLHLLTHTLLHDSTIHQTLNVWEVMVHKLVQEWIHQSLEELVLLLRINVYFIRSIAGQLDKFVPIFYNSHALLLKG